MWVFAQSPLDRQSHLRSSLEHLYAWRNHQDRNIIAFDKQQRVLATKPASDSSPEALSFINLSEHVDNADLNEKTLIFLGTYQSTPWFGYELEALPQTLEQQAEWFEVWPNLGLLEEPFASILAYAKALLYWHQTHQFCGQCGSATHIKNGGHERQCGSCERMQYPRTDQAIIVATTFEDKLLLGRQKHWAEGQYSVLAGFVEPGESLEQAVQREVMEEAGIPVTDVQYLGSQPWPFPCSLMIGFTAKAEHMRTQLFDDELEEVLWISPQDYLDRIQAKTLRRPRTQSISGHLIKHWLASHQLQLP